VRQTFHPGEEGGGGEKGEEGRVWVWTGQWAPWSACLWLLRHKGNEALTSRRNAGLFQSVLNKTVYSPVTFVSLALRLSSCLKELPRPKLSKPRGEEPGGAGEDLQGVRRVKVNNTT